MRKKIIKILKKAEKIDDPQCFKAKYEKGNVCGKFIGIQTMFFPNVEYVFEQLCKNHFQCTRELVEIELKRMYKDGFILLDKQDVIVSADWESDIDGNVDMENDPIESEKIILTTRGKSLYSYWKNQVVNEPLALLAFFFSLISITISIFK